MRHYFPLAIFEYWQTPSHHSMLWLTCRSYTLCTTSFPSWDLVSVTTLWETQLAVPSVIATVVSQLRETSAGLLFNDCRQLTPEAVGFCPVTAHQDHDPRWPNPQRRDGPCGKTRTKRQRERESYEKGKLYTVHVLGDIGEISSPLTPFTCNRDFFLTLTIHGDESPIEMRLVGPSLGMGQAIIPHPVVNMKHEIKW